MVAKTPLMMKDMSQKVKQTLLHPSTQRTFLDADHQRIVNIAFVLVIPCLAVLWHQLLLVTGGSSTLGA